MCQMQSLAFQFFLCHLNLLSPIQTVKGVRTLYSSVNACSSVGNIQLGILYSSRSLSVTKFLRMI